MKIAPPFSLMNGSVKPSLSLTTSISALVLLVQMTRGHLFRERRRSAGAAAAKEYVSWSRSVPSRSVNMTWMLSPPTPTP